MSPIPRPPSVPMAALERLGEEPLPLSFEDLRRKGIQFAQELSGQTWTDFNLHDPGVTLLEAFCFALTEGVYRAERDVADHLCAPDGQIHLHRHALHPPMAVFPTRCVTGRDYFQFILDRVPDLTHLRIHSVPPQAGVPGGLWELEFLNKDGTSPGAVAREAAQAYWSQRNLCEDLAAVPRALKVVPCTLEAVISVSGPREVTEIVTEFYRRCAQLIAGEPLRLGQFAYLEAGLKQGATLADLLEGPVNRFGWIPTENIADVASRRIFFGDLVRQLQDLDGISEITGLRLTTPSHPDPVGSIPWSAPGWHLQLRLPTTADELKGIQIHRGGARIPLAPEAILENFHDLETLKRRPPVEHAQPDQNPLLATPQGTPFEDAPFYPTQMLLPPIYREGLPALEPGAKDPGPRAMSPTFQGFLALMEQWLAHSESQGGHVRDLFSLDAGPGRSYWWQVLGNAHLPGLEDLLLVPPERIQAEVFEPLDPGLDRRGRILDFLLALHGESFGQNQLRVFGRYFDPGAWERHLFEQKRLMLQDILQGSQDRAGGFDYSRPSWGQGSEDRHNTSALQKRLGLLLGFRHLHSRPLCQALAGLGLRLGRPGEGSPFIRADLTGPRPDWRTVPFELSSPGALPQLSQVAAMAQTLPLLRTGVLPPELWHAAIDTERYWYLPQDFGGTLVLGPDENGAWWQLANLSDLPTEARPHPPTVESVAQGFRDTIRLLHLETEGVHLVEHILLRPLGPGQEPQEAWPSHGLTAVFPKFTARGGDPNFRRLARETLQLNLPAHILGTCLWLDPEALQSFETEYLAWLEARIAHCADLEGPEPRARLDRCSARLRLFLQTHANAHPAEP